jgi:DNA polymerase elongation subunit (family B)
LKNNFIETLSVEMDTLIVQPYDWTEVDNDDSYEIRIWCHYPYSPGVPNHILLIVRDYAPFCRIELPTSINNRNVVWDANNVRIYASWLMKVLGSHAPIKMEFSNLQKIYYYSTKKYPFLTCYFHNNEALRHCSNLVTKTHTIPGIGAIQTSVHEKSITNIHKFVTKLGITYCQWLKVTGNKVQDFDKISTCEEYLVSYKDIQPADSQNLLARPMIAAIDIECYSSDLVSLPNQNYIDNVITQISVISQISGLPETRRKYILVLGEEQVGGLELYGWPCSDIPNVQVLRYSNEIHMLNGMSDLLIQIDPSIIIGYNIYKFDFPYINGRLRLRMSKIKSFSLIKNEETAITSRSWYSSAYGTVTITLLNASGRVCLDMYTIIKRDNKLRSYTLDFVSKSFLGHGKHDVSAKEMFHIYRDSCLAARMGSIHEQLKSMREVARVAAYCVEDSCLCIDLFDKLNTWITLVEMSNIVLVPLITVVTAGQQVRIQNKVYQYAFNNDIVIDERQGPSNDFEGATVVKPLMGRKTCILIFDFASLYPSIIREQNICYTTLVGPNDPIDRSLCNKIEWFDERNKKYCFYFVKKEVFHGILPRICEELVSERKKTRAMISSENSDIHNMILNKRQLALKVSANSVFGSLGVTEGRLPLLEGASCITAKGRQLINMAAEYVKTTYNGEIIYGDTDSIMVDLKIEDPHQCVILGKKLSDEINSLFNRPLSLDFERALLIGLYVKKKKYSGIPVTIVDLKPGDTLTKVKTKESMLVLAHRNNNKLKVIGVVEKFFPIKLEIGEVVIVSSINNNKAVLDNKNNQVEFYPFIAGMLFSGLKNETTCSDIISEDVLMIKGLAPVRREYCNWVAKIVEKTLLNVLLGRDLSEALYDIDSEIVKMLTHQVELDNLITTRNVGSNYKADSSYPLKIFIDELEKKGKPLQGGDRVDIVFVKLTDPEKNSKQGYKMRLPEDYLANKILEPLDQIHYVKMLMNPVEQILNLGFNLKPHVKTRRITMIPSQEYIKTWIRYLEYRNGLIEIIEKYKPYYERYGPHF